MHPRAFLSFSGALFAASVLACTAEAPSGLLAMDAALASDVGGGPSVATLQVRCDIGAKRSSISILGRHLTPSNSMWTAHVISGVTAANAPAERALLDRVEVEFDSNLAKIAAGATAIASGFIVVSATGPDVAAELRNNAGEIMAVAFADCTVR